MMKIGRQVLPLRAIRKRIERAEQLADEVLGLCHNEAFSREISQVVRKVRGETALNMRAIFCVLFRFSLIFFSFFLIFFDVFSALPPPCIQAFFAVFARSLSAPSDYISQQQKSR